MIKIIAMKSSNSIIMSIVLFLLLVMAIVFMVVSSLNRSIKREIQTDLSVLKTIKKLPPVSQIEGQPDEDLIGFLDSSINSTGIKENLSVLRPARAGKSNVFSEASVTLKNISKEELAEFLLKVEDSNKRIWLESADVVSSPEGLLDINLRLRMPRFAPERKRT